MTYIGVALPANCRTFSGTILVPRRLRALFRLMAIRRRRHCLAVAIDFADPRIQADVGAVMRRHRHDWFETFLAPLAGR